MPIWRTFFSHLNCRSSWMKFREPVSELECYEWPRSKWTQDTRQAGIKLNRRIEGIPWLPRVCNKCVHSLRWHNLFFQLYQTFKGILILFCSAYSSRQAEGVFVKKFRTIQELNRWTMEWMLNQTLSPCGGIRISLNLHTHLWIESHPGSSLDIDSRCWCTPPEIFSQFDRLRFRSISTIQSVACPLTVLLFSLRCSLNNHRKHSLIISSVLHTLVSGPLKGDMDHNQVHGEDVNIASSRACTYYLRPVEIQNPVGDPNI